MNAYPSDQGMQALNLGMDTYADQPKIGARKNSLFGDGVNRLMSAAAVSPRFCRQLLSDPLSALAAGFHGESFPVTPEEVRLLSSIHANSLRNFAAQLVELVQQPVCELRNAWTPPASATYGQPVLQPARAHSRTHRPL